MHIETNDYYIGRDHPLGAAGAGVDGVTGDPTGTIAGVSSGDAAPRPGGSPGPRPDAPGTAPDGGTPEAPQPHGTGAAQVAADATAAAPTDTSADTSAPSYSASGQGGMPTHEEFNEIVQRANKREAGALAELRELLDRNPAIWQYIGDLSMVAEATLIDLIASRGHLKAECLRRSIDAMRAKLSLPGASYLDELAVSRVVACWLNLQHCETCLTRADAGTKPATFWLKRQTQADRSYNAAMKSLSDMRRLLPAAAVESPQPAPQATAAAPTAPAVDGKSGSRTIPITPFLDSQADSQVDVKRAVGM